MKVSDHTHRYHCPLSMDSLSVIHGNFQPVMARIHRLQAMHGPSTCKDYRVFFTCPDNVQRNLRFLYISL